MMNTKQKQLLWRVVWSHVRGYQAPCQYVRAEKPKDTRSRDEWELQMEEIMKDVHKRTKMASRLSDFPNSWSYRLEKIKGKNEKDVLFS